MFEMLTEAVEESIDAEIEELREQPEFSSINGFIEHKLDNDEYTYNFIELNALARNLTQKKLVSRNRAVEASKADIDAVHHELVSVGFQFVGREKERSVRGFKKGAHGTNPFAGAGGGGSGFGSDYGGSTFTSFGGGPGAMGGGYSWNANDKRNLPMGSRKR
jgi:hypothetical protein